MRNALQFPGSSEFQRGHASPGALVNADFPNAMYPQSEATLDMETALFRGFLAAFRKSPEARSTALRMANVSLPRIFLDDEYEPDYPPERWPALQGRLWAHAPAGQDQTS